MSSKVQYQVLITKRTSATRGVPPGKEDVLWVGSSSTLIHDGKDSVLVDTFLGKDDNETLVEWVIKSGYNLKYIYITHGHGDHWYGAHLLLQQFPQAQVLATKATIECMKENVSQEWLGLWQRLFPGQVPRHADQLLDPNKVKPVNDTNYTFQLGGYDLIAHEAGFTDTHSTTYLHIPSIDLVVSGDIVYNQVFPYLANTTTETRQEWLKALDSIAALNPKNVVPGHTIPEGGHDPKHIEETKKVLLDFNHHIPLSDSVLDLYNKVLALHPHRVNPGSLWAGSNAEKGKQ
ncbi:Hydroxyacylglutathione hydrolase [Apophysomyces sp. BC1034]|nr:Hydroxyacylglutathione hydrolase [Apophysomyces sp. BC1015]KAG0173944.1 Hydroxyacylglutathione hydrolase [Apophysomyces sp. BC1021]KAG0185067.1 Hydroxyacylglutathione hydrolase [Apophysomyces sp. BC1034]